MLTSLGLQSQPVVLLTSLGLQSQPIVLLTSLGLQSQPVVLLPAEGALHPCALRPPRYALNACFEGSKNLEEHSVPCLTGLRQGWRAFT